MTPRSAWSIWLRGTAALAVLALAGSSAFGGGSGYTIRRGDTISSLAVRFQVTQAALVQANHLADPNRIYAGHVLLVPPRAGVAGVSSSVDDVVTPGPLAAVTVPARGPLQYPPDLLAHASRITLLPTFRRWAAVSKVPAGLLEALAWMESGWRSSVVSRTGAVGIGQIEPATATFISTQLLGSTMTLDTRDTDANIRMSATYLAWLLRQTNGDIATALGGYYQGLRTLRAAGPLNSTRRYVAGVGALWGLFRSG